MYHQSRRIIALNEVLILLLILSATSCTPNQDKVALHRFSTEKQYNKEGNLHGYYKNFYSDGSPESIVMYDNGLEDGPAIWYYPNGEVKVRCLYSKGKKTDEAYWYNDNGVPQSFIYYHHENPEALYRRDYTQSGTIKAEDGTYFPVTYINKFEPNINDTLRAEFYIAIPPLTTNRLMIEILDAEENKVLSIDTFVLQNPFIVENIMTKKGKYKLHANIIVKNEKDRTESKRDFYQDLLVK